MFIKEGRAWTYAMFAVVVLSSALGNLSQTGLNAMMVAVCADFDTDPSVGQWLTTLYMFVLGAVVPLSSYLMGRFRCKDLVLLAIGLFCAGALAAACAPAFWVLLAGRVVQAVSAGMLLPLMQTIAMTRFPAGRKATAMGIAGIAMGFAPNIGPTIGGSMVDALGWRSFFVLLVGISAALFLFCLACIKRRSDASYPADLDFPSFALVTAGFGGVLMGASQASSFSFAHPLVWAPLLAGAAALVVFARRQKQLEHPLVDLGIFKAPSFRAGFWALNALFASFMGITLLVPLYVQGICGGTALEAGMVLLPGTVAALFGNPLAGVLTDKVGARPVTIAGGLCLVAGAFSMVACTAETPLAVVCAMQGVRSLGVSSLIGPLTSWSLGRLRGKSIGDGSAFGIASRQACASVGTAVMVLFATGLPLVEPVAAFQAAFAFSALMSAITFGIIVARVR